jgi:hypothetical protein
MASRSTRGGRAAGAAAAPVGPSPPTSALQCSSRCLVAAATSSMVNPRGAILCTRSCSRLFSSKGDCKGGIGAPPVDLVPAKHASDATRKRKSAAPKGAPAARLTLGQPPRAPRPHVDPGVAVDRREVHHHPEGKRGRQGAVRLRVSSRAGGSTSTGRLDAAFHNQGALPPVVARFAQLLLKRRLVHVPSEGAAGAFERACRWRQRRQQRQQQTSRVGPALSRETPSPPASLGGGRDVVLWQGAVLLGDEAHEVAALHGGAAARLRDRGTGQLGQPRARSQR